MSDIYRTVVRSVMLIVGLFVITKLLGKKQLSSLSFFEYIVGITVGDIAGTLSMDPDLSLKDGIASMIVWSFVPFAISMISLKSRIFRQIVEGKSTVFIDKGKIIEKNLHKEKYSMDELLEQLHKKNVFRVADVEFATLDSNGELSVLLKKAKQPLKYGDVFRNTGEETKALAVIMDGKIIEENLRNAGFSEEQLFRRIKAKGYQLEEVFFAEADEKGDISLDLYDEVASSAIPDIDKG